MTKKEQAQLDELATRFALRWREFAPKKLGATNGLTRCWFYNTGAGIGGSTRVSEGCKDGMFYSSDRTDKTTSRSDYGQCKAYVSKLDALYAARLEAQADYAKRLRQIDAMIEEEEAQANVA